MIQTQILTYSSFNIKHFKGREISKGNGWLIVIFYVTQNIKDLLIGLTI